MKALVCGKCFDIRALDPDGAWTVCHCGNTEARWLDPQAGTVRVRAKNRSVARILGVNNRFFLQAVKGLDLDIREDEWAAWRKLHDEATDAKGYIFDKAFRSCWACIFQVGETGDVKWEEEPPKETTT